MSNYWALFYEIPAAISLGPLVVNLLPFSIDKKLNPLVMFLSALLTMLFPIGIDLALGMCIPIGFAYGQMGVRLQGHEPVHLPVEQARTVVHRVRERLRREDIPTDGPSEDILTKEYPDPAKPPVEKFIPEL